MFYKKITQLEIELSTKCNASCPQCSRNFYGGKTWSTLPLVDLTLDVIKKSISDCVLKDLVEIRICGTYGDPCIHKDFIDIVKYLNSKTDAQLTINTNGSLRSVDWWKNLASVLKKDDIVIFGIDGLADTNHLYRIGTNFKKIMKNAEAFISAGGSAVWSYIVFKHNQHQVDEARAISKEMKFHGFACKLTTRFIDKQHKFIDKTPVYNKFNRVTRYLEMPTDPRYLNKGYSNYDGIIKEYGTYKNYLQSAEIFCTAQHSNLVYISAEGYVLPCGWLSDRFYGFETEHHEDRQKLFSLIESNGGLESIDLHKNSLDEIVKGKVFQAIQKNWTAKNRIERCANQCSIKGMLKQDATKDLQQYVKGNI
jgi:MoaA/NifB/PqqE/SkfB family radical SAM enzyme